MVNTLYLASLDRAKIGAIARTPPECRLARASTPKRQHPTWIASPLTRRLGRIHRPARRPRARAVHATCHPYHHPPSAARSSPSMTRRQRRRRRNTKLRSPATLSTSNAPPDARTHRRRRASRRARFACQSPRVRRSWRWRRSSRARRMTPAWAGARRERSRTASRRQCPSTNSSHSWVDKSNKHI